MRTVIIIVTGVLAAALAAALASVSIYGLWLAAAIKDPALGPASVEWSIALGVGLGLRGMIMRLWAEA